MNLKKQVRFVIGCWRWLVVPAYQPLRQRLMPALIYGITRTF